MSSWIKLQRDIRDHWIFDNADYFKAWVCILIEVNHKNRGFMIKNTPINCGRGQSAMSLKSWSDKFGKGWTVQKVRTFFKHLVNNGMISIEEIPKITTKLTVCNYDTYQGDQHKGNTKVTQTQHKGNTNLTTIEETKNLETKNEEFNLNCEIEESTCLTFDEFWNLYDKKKEVKKCRDKYSKIKESERELIKSAVKVYVESTPDKQFRKNPSTWLNNQCWNDEIESSKPKSIEKLPLFDLDRNTTQIYMSEDEANSKRPEGAVNNGMVSVNGKLYFNPWAKK